MAPLDAEAPSAIPDQTKPDNDEPMVQLSKYILLLATLVATVTYAAGFNPPGGVWQDAAAGRLAGDPIFRYISKTRYLVFFYSNATAFASSLVVIVVVFFLTHLYEKMHVPPSVVVPLRGVMVLDLVSLMGAYAAATCRDTLTTIYSSELVAAVFIYLVIQMVRAQLRKDEAPTKQAEASDHAVLKKQFRKVLMLLATFAVSVTYAAGMSAPGGFWDNNAEGGHRPGDAILKDRHGTRLTVFFCFNTMAFVASLLIIVVLLDKNYSVNQAYVWITVALTSLIGAYTAGSCRQIDTTVYVVSLVGAVLVFIIFLQAVRSKIRVLQNKCPRFSTNASGSQDTSVQTSQGPSGSQDTSVQTSQGPSGSQDTSVQTSQGPSGSQDTSVQTSQGPEDNKHRKEAEKARSLVLLLATLAATITYQAGLDPPGGVWPENGNGHMAGDPILLKTNPRRYKAFFYCNSVAFVASLVAIILVQKKLMLKTHVLEAAMILDLFGLIGAYAAGSCRDVSTSIYAMALAGAVLVYVVIHVVFITLDHTNTDTGTDTGNIEKRRKRLLLFAVLAATMTYQAGLTPPGGFRLQDDWSSGHHAGDPVLFYNFPRRYTAFFYCNSVSFMLSIALIILLVNPHLYRPAIRSYALSVCTVAGMFGLMGAYAAGSTQYLKTSIYILVLVGVVLFVIALLVLVFVVKEMDEETSDNAQSPSASRELEDTGTVDDEEKKKQPELKELHAKRKYLMLLGILVASVTYQAGLDPPGGAWQQSGDGHDAGNPVLHDTNRPRYLTFFYSNSISFVASIVIIIHLIVQWMEKVKLSFRLMNTAIVLDLLALLIAYAAGSSRGWKASLYAVALVIAVLAYVAIHIALAFLCVYWRSAPIRRVRAAMKIVENLAKVHLAEEKRLRQEFERRQEVQKQAFEERMAAERTHWYDLMKGLDAAIGQTPRTDANPSCASCSTHSPHSSGSNDPGAGSSQANPSNPPDTSPSRNQL